MAEKGGGLRGGVVVVPRGPVPAEASDAVTTMPVFFDTGLLVVLL